MGVVVVDPVGLQVMSSRCGESASELISLETPVVPVLECQATAAAVNAVNGKIMAVRGDMVARITETAERLREAATRYFRD